MEFGKLESVAAVDFSLPHDDPRTWAALRAGRVEGGRSFEAFLGAPAWGSKAWHGQIYPRGAKPAELLGLYAERFTCIELNATHYRIPDLETVRRWRDATPEGFRFCPKVPQEITHRHFLKGAARETDAFFAAVAELGSRLGCCFAQLPPHFAPADLPLLRAWLRQVPRGFALAVEFRHPAFFEGGVLRADAYDVLREARAQTVITDVAGRRDVLHASLTGPTVFLRLILNSLHPSDYARGEAWAARLASWKKLGLRDAYLIVHQPDDVETPEFAQNWAETLNKALGTELKGPLDRPLLERAPGRRDASAQLGFFD